MAGARKTAAKKTAAGRAAARKAAPGKTAAKRAAPREASPKAAAPGRAAAKAGPAKARAAAKAPAKKEAPAVGRATRGGARTGGRAGETPTFSARRSRADAGGQSGDLQGLSGSARADSESVDELVEEGNAFEADVVSGVEEADNADEQEVHTHEVAEDDVPDEYLDKDE